MGMASEDGPRPGVPRGNDDFGGLILLRGLKNHRLVVVRGMVGNLVAHFQVPKLRIVALARCKLPDIPKPRAIETFSQRAGVIYELMAEAL